MDSNKEVTREDREGTPWFSFGAKKPTKVRGSTWIPVYDPNDSTRIMSWNRKTNKRIEQNRIDAQDAQAPKGVDTKKMDEAQKQAPSGWTDH